ncbi:hypothetical protein P4O66_018727, partial [Electrophorus voltai]
MHITKGTMMEPVTQPGLSELPDSASHHLLSTIRDLNNRAPSGFLQSRDSIDPEARMVVGALSCVGGWCSVLRWWVVLCPASEENISPQTNWGSKGTRARLGGVFKTKHKGPSALSKDREKAPAAEAVNCSYSEKAVYRLK